VNPVTHALRHGAPVADPMFDLVFPAEQRLRSWVHWTPLEVAVRASAVLAWKPRARVLDVGAGVGKLCLVGALTTDASWFGLEQDPHMVEGARLAAVTLGVHERVTFLQGDATQIEWPEFDAVYLFNPFAERRLCASERGEDGGQDVYEASVEAVRARLAGARPGTRVVTYFGFGGAMPLEYELIHREIACDDELCVWVRHAQTASTGTGT
jgi:SAM-dependent methyltransferase